MQIDRRAIAGPSHRPAGIEALRALGLCLGCRDCAGVCAALVDLMSLPDLVLKPGRAP